LDEARLADLRNFWEEKLTVAQDFTIPGKSSGGIQYCSNNAATLGTPFFTFINPVVRNKLGSDGAICTSTSSYHRVSLDQLAQIRYELKPTSMSS